MAAERRCSASRDGAHDAPLGAAEVTFVSTAIGVAVAANDVRHLHARGHLIRSGGRHDLQRQPIERALGVSDKLVRDARVARARQIGVPQQHLNDADFSAFLQQMCSSWNLI